MIGDDDNKKIIMFTRGRCFETSQTTALHGSSMDGWVHEDNRGNQKSHCQRDFTLSIKYSCTFYMTA